MAVHCNQGSIIDGHLLLITHLLHSKLQLFEFDFLGFPSSSTFVFLILGIFVLLISLPSIILYHCSLSHHFSFLSFPLSLSLYLSIYLSIYLSFSLSISVSISLPLYPSLYFSTPSLFLHLSPVPLSPPSTTTSLYLSPPVSSDY